jgi:SAM-dependent methyltransferase
VGAAPEVSRRGLFSRGVARLVPGREDVAAVGAAVSAYRDAEAGLGPEALAERARAVWSPGDRPHPFAALAPAAAALVSAAAVRPGQTVLDAAAGDGNVAVAAAERGAAVTALDLIPELVERGRARCERAGAGVDWHVGDVERMPFPDGAFDAVLSSFGAMFAPHPRAVASELARVTRPGGAIGMANWSSSGPMGRVLDLAAALDAPPPGSARPARWGRYESAFLWLGSVVERFGMANRSLRLRFPSAEAACADLCAPPGPLAAVLGGASAERRRQALERLDALVATFAEETSGGIEIDAGYTLVSGARPELADAPVTGLRRSERRRR